MTAHDHSTYQDWCYRCELGRDEAQVPAHACDSLEMDWGPCQPPGCMIVHRFCSVCGERQGYCPLDVVDESLPGL
jgi:hypothetical protein